MATEALRYDQSDAYRKKNFVDISQDIFDFPGGRRFHFVDPVGTEFAVWSAPDEVEQ